MRENRQTQKPKKKNGTKILVVILVLLILVAGGLFALKVWQDNTKNNETSTGENAKPEEKPVEKKPVTFAGNTRSMAFMIDNNINAMPQAGLLQADLVYEIIVEGGETRLMAVIKDKDLSKVGPLRSARHYFIDYALENDALYVHYGQSPQAEKDIKSLAVADINGINESTSSFWRVKDRYAPHNAVTDTSKITKIAERKKYRTTSEKESVLNYVVDEVNLESETVANTITIPYSPSNTVKYTYDAEAKNYIRYSRGKKQTDWNSKETVTTKNIIITKCKNTTLNDGTEKGRQTLDNIKTLDGYYITNGKVIPITCEKTSRTSQTIYKDMQGNEIKVNDGKTFIQICPIDAKISFE